MNPFYIEIDARIAPMVWRLWVEYEGKKQQWLTEHPSATPSEVAAACRAIANSLGT